MSQFFSFSEHYIVPAQYGNTVAEWWLVSMVTTCEERCFVSTVSGSWMVTDFTPASTTSLAMGVGGKEGEREERE